MAATELDQRCPGCLHPIAPDEVSCTGCWTRAPLDLRLMLNAARRHADGYAAEDAHHLLDDIRCWLRHNPGNDLHNRF